ncbi:MAG: PAS domain S-box protein [Halorhodospira sp.]
MSADGPDRLIGFEQDVTEHRQLLERSEERRQQLEAILDAVPGVSLAQVDLVGVIEEASQSAERILGCSRAELIGSNFRSFHEPADQARVGRAIADLQRAGQTHTAEYDLIRGSGQRFRARLTVAPLVNGRGEVVSKLGACINLSEQGRALRMVGLARCRLRSAGARSECARAQAAAAAQASTAA